MARKPASAGTCAFCGRQVAGTGMTKHLATCAETPGRHRQGRGEQKRRHRSRSITSSCLHTIDRLYWLHLEVAGSSTLVDVNHLRDLGRLRDHA